MKTTIINPWNWQYNLGYSQAIEVKNNEITLYGAGQAAMDANGQAVEGSMSEQIKLSLPNLHTVIKEAGYHPANLLRLHFYTTSIPSFFGAFGEVIMWLKNHSSAPVSTLIQVEAFVFPQLTIEVEATLAK